MAVIQRPLKGSRISSFYPVKTLPPLTSLDSAFQLQEYISLLIRLDVHDVETIISMPGRQLSPERESSDGANGDEKDGKTDVTVDESCWIYEQLRRLAQDLTHPLITTLQQECTRSTCPEMKAGEWLYLCVAHGNEGAMEQCCAIDYILHTLDSATALLNSPRAFPSRLSIPPTSTRHFSSLARRLGRIFAHAYYHHREAFEQAEAESSLYARFLALTSKFNLVPSEFIMIPPRIGSIEEELEREEQNSRNSRGSPEAEPRQPDSKQWLALNDSGSAVNLTIGRSSPPDVTAIARNASPRRMGRTRTDTMVYSDAANIAEQLARNDNFTEADLDRAIAEERMLAAISQPLPEPFVVSQPEHQDLPPESEPSPGESHEAEVSELAKEEEDTALTQEAEVVLDIAAPAPAEPAIPTDVEEEEEEEDITDDSAVQEASEEDSAPLQQPEQLAELPSRISTEESAVAGLVQEHVELRVEDFGLAEPADDAEEDQPEKSLVNEPATVVPEDAEAEESVASAELPEVEPVIPEEAVPETESPAHEEEVEDTVEQYGTKESS